LKVSIITYSESYAVPLNSSSISTTANETLAKSDVCKGINMANRMIDGKSGVYAKGIKCPLEEPVIVAIYPLDYHLDRPGGVLTANALSIILSTYDQVISDRLINSINIVQTK
jgi:hypothetical protein